jgi:hypothetical protein
MNEWGGELFDPSTTPSLRATPPVPGGELLLFLLQFIHSFDNRASSEKMFRKAELSATTPADRTGKV